jgi:GrpB-like predicted nucleotidyltransferase (UPF0157 family)
VIVIHDYNPAWPQEFETIKADLEQILGALALRIDHIGSTSVAGLGAKDVIDIQVTVARLEPAIKLRMKAAGYRHREHIAGDHVPRGEDPNPALWQKLFFKQPEGRREANIHVRLEGNPNQRYALLFRDYLRAHPNAVQTVELIKRELARHLGHDIEAYYDIKDPVYDLIWEAAKDWAK